MEYTCIAVNKMYEEAKYRIRGIRNLILSGEYLLSMHDLLSAPPGQCPILISSQPLFPGLGIMSLF